MANRVFVSAVVLLWLCSMGWLFTERILPSLVDGQPPAFETFQSGEAVAWSVEWDGKRVGEAASLRLPGTDGSVELHNRITLRNMPIAELAPAWMRMAIPNLGEMSMDVVSRIEFDPLGKFSAFNSKVSLNSMPSVFARVRIDCMVSWTELMKHAEHCGFCSRPTLNQTGELKQAYW